MIMKNKTTTTFPCNSKSKTVINENYIDNPFESIYTTAI